jgi:photosystem II stability/assembly factor-like uncharacterized protein
VCYSSRYQAQKFSFEAYKGIKIMSNRLFKHFLRCAVTLLALVSITVHASQNWRMLDGYNASGEPAWGGGQIRGTYFAQPGGAVTSPEWFVPTQGGGVFRSTDYGNTWTEVNNGLGNLLVRSFQGVSTANGAVWNTRAYVATLGGGIFYTADSGANWTAVNGSGPTALGCTNALNLRVLTGTTAAQDILYAATGCTTGVAGNVWKSNDGGANWSLSSTGIPADATAYSLGFANVNITISGTGRFYFVGTDKGLFRSQDGSNWSLIHAGSATRGAYFFSVATQGSSIGQPAAGNLYKGLAVIPGVGMRYTADYTSPSITWVTPTYTGTSQPTTVNPIDGGGDFVTFNGTSTMLVTLEASGVWKSINQGATWTQDTTLSNGLRFAPRGFRSMTGNGATDLWAWTYQGMYYSTNAGATWTKKSNGLPAGGYVLTANTDIWADGGNIRAGGNYYNNPANVWQSVLGTNPPVGTGTVSTDKYFRSDLPGQANEMSFGFASAIRSTTLNKAWYMGTGQKGIYKSIDNGATWAAVNTGLPADMTEQFPQITVNRTNQDLVYLGLSGGGVYKTTNGGGVWTALNNGLTGDALYAGTVVVDPNNPNLLMVGTRAGLQRSTDGGASWAPANPGGTPYPIDTLSFAVSNPNVVFLGGSNSNGDGSALVGQAGLYVSADAGSTWTNLFPDRRIISVRAHYVGDQLRLAFVERAANGDPAHNGVFMCTNPLSPTTIACTKSPGLATDWARGLITLNGRFLLGVTTNNGVYAYEDTDADQDNDGIPDFVELNEQQDPWVKDNNIFSGPNAARLMAMQQYRDFLGREGDIGGIVNWTNAMQAGVSKPLVVESFFNSQEFQLTVSPIVRLYWAYFNRIPDYGGLTNWTYAYRAGVPLNVISSAFASSQEFINTYGALNNTQFATLLYQNVLKRQPDAGGLAAWVGALDAGMSRGDAMLGFSESAEFKLTSYNRVYVTMMYVGMLKRSPDQGGFDAWTGYMDAGFSGLNLIQGFFDSQEYRNRFLP